MKKTYIFFIILFMCSGAAATVKLCAPLHTINIAGQSISIRSSDKYDGIGGLKSSRLQEYVDAVETKLPQEGWARLGEEPFNFGEGLQCTRIFILPKSTIFVNMNGRWRWPWQEFGALGEYARDFPKAIMNEKKELISFYEKTKSKQRIKITDDDYNRLAYLAMGILGAESSSGTSIMHYMESMASTSVYLEWLWECSVNGVLMGGVMKKSKLCTKLPKTSRGLTQIRDLPEISRQYGITRRNLHNYYNAGVATMAFLIETYKQYINVITNNNCTYKTFNEVGRVEIHEMKRDDFEVFLTYMYRRGNGSELKSGTATPQKNCYYKRVQRYQEYIQIFVNPKQSCTEAGPSVLD